MKISEIVDSLLAIKAEHGDLSCSMDLEAQTHGMSGPIKSIRVDNKVVVISNIKPKK